MYHFYSYVYIYRVYLFTKCVQLMQLTIIGFQHQFLFQLKFVRLKLINIITIMHYIMKSNL